MKIPELKKKLGLIFFLFSRLLSTISEQLNSYAIPLIIFEFTNRASKNGEAYLIEWLPSVLILPFLGLIVDYFKERCVYIIGDILRCVVCLVGVIIITYEPHLTYIVLVAVSLFLAILNSQNFVALESTIGRHFDKNEIPFLQTCIQGIESISEVVAPILAGLLVVIMPKEYFLFITGFIFLLTGFGVIGIPNKKQAIVTEKSISNVHFLKVFKDIQKGYQVIFGNLSLVLLVTLTFTANLILGTITVLRPAILVGVLKGTSQQYAFVVFIGGLCQVIVLSFLAFIVRHLNLKYIGIVSGVFMAFSGIVIGFSSNISIYIFGYSLIVSGISIFNVFLRSERIKLIPKENLGKTMGSIVFFNRLSLPLSGLIVARGTLLVSSQQVVLIIGLFSSIVIVICLILFLRRKN